MAVYAVASICDAYYAIIRLKGKLKSRFNLTKVDAKGNYVFKAKNVNSDVLEGELL